MRSLFLLIAIFVSCSCVAQEKYAITCLPFNSSDAGWYAALKVGKQINNRYAVNIGATYHYNQVKEFGRINNLYFHKRFKADKPIEYFGLQGEIQYNIHSLSNSSVNTYLFYELTARNIGAQNLHYTYYTTVSDTSYFNGKRYIEGPYDLYSEKEVIIHHLWAFENIVGAGTSVKIKGNLRFVLNVGVGTNIIFNVPDYIAANKVVAEYSFKTNLGLSYLFR